MDTNTSTPMVQATATPKSPAAVKFFAIGNAGLKVAEQAISAGLAASSVIAIDSDAGSLGSSSAGEKMQLEKKLLQGLGSGGDPERGRTMAEEHFAALKSLCENVGTVAIIAGLGGGSGTGISPVLARAAREAGALTLAFVILPFECEGNLRRRVAEIGLAQLREVADLVVTLPNERTLSIITEVTSLVDTFKASNEIMAQGLRAAWAALTGKSVMGLPFTDLCRATRPVCSEYQLASAEAGGANRVAELLEKLFVHPMLTGSEPLPGADSIAICLIGGPGLAMVEVNRIMEKLQQQAQSAPILMGAVVDPEMADRLAVTLLVGRSGGKEDPAAGLPASCRTVQNPDADLVKRSSSGMGHSRFVAPPPELSPEQMQQIRTRQTGGGRSRKPASRLRQTQLPLEIVSRGRFDNSEPTIHKGEDLDVPTYIRRGVSLN